MWDRVTPALSGRFRTLRYDTRGHGRSSVPAGPYSLADLGNDVVGLLDLLGIERCVFCGLSLGGMTGIWLGINAQHRVSRMVLANTAAKIGTRERWNERIQAVQQGGVDSIAEAVLERWFTTEFERGSPDVIDAARRMLADTPREGYAGCAAAIRDADLTSELHRITTPAMVIAGTFDPATTPEDGRVLARGIKGAEYVELKTAHLSAIEDPNGFTSAALGFLKE